MNLRAILLTAGNNLEVGFERCLLHLNKRDKGLKFVQASTDYFQSLRNKNLVFAHFLRPGQKLILNNICMHIQKQN